MHLIIVAVLIALVLPSEAQTCGDKNKDCPNWTGSCNKSEYVRLNCDFSCGRCRRPSPFRPVTTSTPKSSPFAGNLPASTFCGDLDKNCPGWVALDFTLCSRSDHISQFCPGSCRRCNQQQPPPQQTFSPIQQQHIQQQQFLQNQQRQQQQQQFQQQHLLQQQQQIIREQSRRNVQQQQQPQLQVLRPQPQQRNNNAAPQLRNIRPTATPAPIQIINVPTKATTTTTTLAPQPPCVDIDDKCNAWVDSSFAMCTNSPYVKEHCKKRCGYCFEPSNLRNRAPREYDIQRLPQSLRPVSWLLGVWRNDHDGKARFPTIPVFTYGEEISFSIADQPQFGAHSLNYTAFAFGINEAKELHSEYGFLAVRNNTNRVALTTVMNNGFVTVEEGDATDGQIKLTLQDIGRISFSRDLPVHDMVRTFTRINFDTMEQKLDMETLTHGMQGHTAIRYKKVFP